MDELVAEKALGWARSGEKWIEPEFGVEIDEVPPFSTDIGAAWKLAEKLCESGYRLRVEGSKIWQASFYKTIAHTHETRAFQATGREAAEAICLAALMFKGVEAGN